MLTRDAILGANDVRFEDVDVPEWGGVVRVREMDGFTRDAWEQSLVPSAPGAGPNVANVRARLVAACIVGDDGKRLFSDADAEALGRKSGVALERVAKVVQRLNGLTAEAVEEARGNLPAGPSAGSTSS